IEYASDLFDRGSVEALGSRLVRLLEGAVAAPDVAIGRLEIVSSAERRQLVEEWNATGRALGGGTIVGHRAARAAGRPEAVAAGVWGARRGAAGCGCGGVRGRAAELRRTGGARQPVGASSSRPWGWGGDGGWGLP